MGILTMNFVGCSSDAREGAEVVMNNKGESKNDVLVPVRIESLPPKDYVAWVENENNGLIVSKQMGGFKFTTFYKPYNYLALVELGVDSINKGKIAKSADEYDGLQYFTYRVSSDQNNTELLQVTLKDDDDYEERLKYFSFDMQNDLKLIEGVDTLDCVMFHYERIYGLAPYATFVLGFPMGEGVTNQDKTISYNDEVFGVGMINMTIKAENISSIPTLTIEDYE